jgi:hypothetical protein
MESVLELPVDFSQVSIGDGTARVGVKVSRDKLKIRVADKQVCGRRLIGQIRVCPKDEDSKQTQMFDDKHHQLSGAFDVKSITITPKALSFGLTFALEGLEISELAHFAKKAGKLVVNEVQAIPEKSKGDGGDSGDETEDDAGDEGEGDSDDSAPVDETTNDTDPDGWRKLPIAMLKLKSTRHQNAFTAACKKKRLKTLGGLAEFIAKNSTWWDKDLGIGPVCAEEYRDADLEFWKTHPNYAKS